MNRLPRCVAGESERVRLCALMRADVFCLGIGPAPILPGMLPLSQALAVVLVTAPVDASCDAPGVPLPALQHVALALELLDPRECRYTFASVEGNSLAADLLTVRKRWAELRDAPPVCDAVRLPDSETILAAKRVNREYRAWLEARQQLLPSEEWIAEAIGECDALYQAWDLASDARTDWYYLAVKRKALLQLRERIGPWDYYRAAMPPPVPIWRFRRME